MGGAGFAAVVIAATWCVFGSLATRAVLRNEPDRSRGRLQIGLAWVVPILGAWVVYVFHRAEQAPRALGQGSGSDSRFHEAPSDAEGS